MSLLNFSVPELLALLGVVTSVTVALYLLDRSRRRQVVATLRFWVSAEQSQTARRRRIQQPFSLLLQLLGMALLLLAAAHLQFSRGVQATSDHVLLLDTSAWMGARLTRTANSPTLLDAAKRSALTYVDRVPGRDRIMVVRSDGLATPATGFETNREVVRQAIRDSSPGATALQLGQALRFAEQIRSRHGARRGEVVYVGPARMADTEPPAAATNLRVLRVASPDSNVGLRQVGVRPSATQAGTWEVFVTVRNDGAATRAVPVVLRFGGAVAGSQQMAVLPGREQAATFAVRTRAAGILDVRIPQGDALAADNHASLEIPAQPVLNLAVYSDEPDLLRPIFATNPNVQARYLRTSDYRDADDAAVVVLDRFRPAVPVRKRAIWIEPPAAQSPVPVRTTLANVPLRGWRSDHPVAAGLRTKGVPLDSVSVLAPARGDVVLVEVEGGPAAVARPGPAAQVVLGFHPLRSAMRYELATPLLFANMLRWLEPDLFRQSELQARSAGVVSVRLPAGTEASRLRLVGDGQEFLPHTLQGDTLRFFAGAPGSVRLIGLDREQVFSLTLPEGADRVWEMPTTVRIGLPGLREELATPWEWWPVLAALGGLVLLAEWIAYGRQRSPRLVRMVARSPWDRVRSRFRMPSRRAS